MSENSGIISRTGSNNLGQLVPDDHFRAKIQDLILDVVNYIRHKSGMNNDELSPRQILARCLFRQPEPANISEQDMPGERLSSLKHETLAGAKAFQILVRMLADSLAARNKHHPLLLPDLDVVAEAVQAGSSEQEIRRVAWPLMYEKLPTQTSIRLLTVSDDLDTLGRISCTTSCVDLEDNPEYTALSYTWGDCGIDPELERTPKVSQKPVDGKFEISCNGQTLDVTRNCFTFLLAFKTMLNGLKRIYKMGNMDAATIRASEFYKKAVKVCNTRSIWIDAICINQEDNQERSSQVRMMDRVYSQAQQVIVWLGPSDDTSNEALSLIADLADVDMRKASQKCGAALDDRSVYDSLGLPYISSENWLAISALYRRRWFTRSWIAQEVALASEVHCLCGNIILPYNSVSKAAVIIRALNWDLLVEVLEIDKKSSYVQNLLQHGAESRTPSHSFTTPMECLRYVSMVPKLKNGTVKSIDGICPAPEVPFQALLYAMQYALCTNPVDKIYSILGLMPKSAWEGIPVDYDLTVEHIFIQTALALIQSTQSLSILSHVDKETYRTMKDLPIWVPDYGAPRLARPLDWGGKEGVMTLPSAQSVFFQASKGLALKFDLLKTPTPALKLQGIYFDTICNSVPFVPGELLIYEPLMDVMESLLRGIVSRTFLADKAVFELKENSKYVDPSRPDRASAIEEWFLNSFFAKLSAHETLIRAKDKDNLQKLLEDWNTTNIYATLREAYISSIIADPQAIPPSEHRRIRDHLKVDFHNPKYKMMSALCARMSDRELFATKQSRLGAARSGIRAGDEIWVLAGAKIPYILRPNGNGQHAFVGEAYMHGIMDGELVEDKRDELQEVVLM